jgi:hypothetical protein
VDLIKENKIQEGVIVKVQNTYAKESNFGGPEIHLNRRSNLTLNPPGVTIELADVSSTITKIKDVKPEQDHNMLVTVVQVFNPIFYKVCPDCRKKVSEPEEGSFLCQEHGKVEPDPAMVLSFVIDDSTDTMRCVAFRRTAETLAGIGVKEAKQNLEEDPQILREKVEYHLLGRDIEIQARIRENKDFERTEAIVNRVTLNPNPKFIANKLTKESKSD